MTRILFISQYLNRAGTEAFMMNVFRGVDRSHFGVDFLLYSRNETDYSKEVEAAGCMVWRVPSRRESPLGWYRSLYCFFKEHAQDYAAVHYCGNGLTAIAPIVLAWRFGIPIRIIHSHNSSSDGLHNRVLHMLQRGLACRLSTHHFACSSLAAKWFFGNSPAVIIRNGIDTRRFAFNPQTREEVRKRLCLKPSTTVIGHVGRFQAEKNHSFLLDVFAQFHKLQPDSMLMLVGVGDLEDSIKKKARKTGIADNVLFLGERSDVEQLLQAMDLFLMPSTFEGQPFVLIEAQCAGLPCLVSDIINKDIFLTESIGTCSLQQPATQWAQRMKEMASTHKRHDESKAIEQQGYSIATTIGYLESVYEGKEGA